MLAAWQTGTLGRFSDLARTRATLAGLGAWGYLAFVVAYAVLQPFGVPGTIFIFVAPLIWTWPIAFALSMAGTMAASVVGFSFARFVARDWIASRIPERFRRYDEALAQRGFATVFLLRFIFWMPPLLHAFFGVSRVSFATHFWGSVVGYLVPLFLVSYFGQQLFEWMRHAPPSAWASTAAVITAIAFGWWWFSRRRATRP
jgi:uncharacterized membrane protein YdjX (TVP38/TMEM64 family)